MCLLNRLDHHRGPSLHPGSHAATPAHDGHAAEDCWENSATRSNAETTRESQSSRASSRSRQGDDAVNIRL